MSAWMEDQIRRVELLFDLIEGEDGATENAAYLGSVSGPGPAGYEPCLGCADNIARVGFCPECNSFGFVRARGGSFDPYLDRAAGPVEAIEREDDGPLPIKTGIVTEENRVRVTSAAYAGVAIEAPESDSYIRRTSVEYLADVRLHHGNADGIDRLKKLKKHPNTPQSILDGIPERRRESMTWFARRIGILKLSFAD